MVPADLRKVNVAPIFKTELRYISGNCRPVSLTSIGCKLLEGVIRDYIQKILVRKTVSLAVISMNS